MAYVGRTNLETNRCQQTHAHSKPSPSFQQPINKRSQAHSFLVLQSNSFTHRKKGTSKTSPIRMINLRLPTHQLLLPRLISPRPPHQIPILLRLKHRYQMDARPHLLPRELTIVAPTDQPAVIPLKSTLSPPPTLPPPFLNKTLLLLAIYTFPQKGEISESPPRSHPSIHPSIYFRTLILPNY